MANQPEFYVFLHGMTENGSVNGGGQIATQIANIFKVPIEQPNLNVPSFAEFSVSNAIRIVDKLYEEKSQGNPSIQMILIGASMGGYIATRYAELRPGRVKRLFLFCPAFGISERVKQVLSEENLLDWKNKGFIDYNGQSLGYVFLEDLIQNHKPYPKVSCPAIILHGKLDKLVPIEASQTFIQEQEQRQIIKLIELDDDHHFSKSLLHISFILPYIAQFLVEPVRA